MSKQAIHHKNRNPHDNTLDNLEVIPMPDDAEEGYCDWLRERDRIENERQAEEAAWAAQEQLQRETDDR